MGKISVVINTFNEELHIPFSLSSIYALADEIVLVDMHSDDETVKIARSFGQKVKVYQHIRTGYVEAARNFAIKKATGDWILILDADEEIPSILANKLRDIVKNPKADYFALPRKNIIFNKWIKHSNWWPDYNVRFFKKGSVYWSELIHSVPETYGKGMDLEAKEELAIIHNNYDIVENYISRMNRYTSIQAKQIRTAALKDKKSFFAWDDLIKKPAAEFMRRYFMGEGYKDGVHGLALASLQAFSELALYLKLWRYDVNLRKHKENVSVSNVIQTMKAVEKDFHYWQADTMVKEKGGILPRIRRKLKI